MIPMQCEYYALEGLSDLVQTIKKVRAHLNPALEIEGLLRTMYDPRNTLAQQVSAQLLEHFGDKVYRTVIPRNVRLAEAPSFGVPALKFDRHSKGAQAYLALAGEMLNRASRHEERGHGQDEGIGTRTGCAAGRGDEPAPAARRLRSLAIDALQPGRFQPRTRMDQEALAELAESIKAQGVMQPILARPLGARAATRSSPASGAGAPRAWRGSQPCRRWCARCPTGTRSPSR